MGYFDALETPVEDIHVGFGLPNDEYEVIISGIKLVENKEKGRDSIVTDFTVTEGKLNGKKHTEWTTIPQRGNQHIEIQASVMKAFLLSIGVPEGMLAEFDAENEDHKEAVVGNTGILSLKPQKKDPQYSQATFKLHDEAHESGVSDFTPGKFDSDPITGEFDPSNF
jgi:hypothetical protein